jgi:SAM-dependent methyltransferase
MARTMLSRVQAQSFDRIASAYDRLAMLTMHGVIDPWLSSQLPTAGRRALELGCGSGQHAALLAGRFVAVDAVDLSGPMIELARARGLPNVTFGQADLLEVAGTARYDLVLSVLTLHHLPDLQAALGHVKTLLAPGGRLVVVDMFPGVADLCPRSALRGVVHRTVPLRLRLRAMAALRLARDLVRRGPATAWEVYRLSVMREWLDHLVSDRFFSREDLERSCDLLFPGFRLDVVGDRRRLGLVWDAP